MVRRGREVNKVVSFGLGLWLPCLTSKICPWPSPPRTLIIVFVSELRKSVNPAFLVNEMQAPSTGGWRPPRHSIYLERGRGLIRPRIHLWCSAPTLSSQPEPWVSLHGTHCCRRARYCLPPTGRQIYSFQRYHNIEQLVIASQCLTSHTLLLCQPQVPRLNTVKTRGNVL